MDQKYCMIVQEVYGREPVAPEGWEFTGEFRPPLRGYWYLSPSGAPACAGGDHTVPYLLLKRATTIKDIYGKELKDLKAPDGWRFTGEFRRVQTTENWMDPHGYACANPLPGCAPGSAPRLILEKLPANPTIEEVYGTATPEIPKGWRFKEFREVGGCKEPKTKILGNLNNKIVYDAEQMGFGPPPWRIVLEKEVDLTTLRHEVMVKDVYGTYAPTIPEGWEVVGFRDVGPYEDYLGAQSGEMLIAPWAGCRAGNPRLILKRR